MRKLLYLLLVLGPISELLAQTAIAKSLPARGITELVADFRYGDVRIVATDQDEISISGTVSINDNRENDRFTLTTETQNGRLLLRTQLAGEDELPRYLRVEHGGKEYRLPTDDPTALRKLKEQLGVDYLPVSEWGASIDIKLRLEVPRRMALSLQALYGNLEIHQVAAPLAAECTYGSLIVVFDRLSGGLSQLKATYKYVDVSLPPRTQAQVELESDYGNIYSNLDVRVNTALSKEKTYSQRIVGTLNEGGSANLKLYSPFGNIYLREK